MKALYLLGSVVIATGASLGIADLWPTPIRQPGAPASSASPTMLLFTTPLGGDAIQTGTTKAIASLNTSRCARIRVVATERVGSPTNVTIRLILMQGEAQVAHLDALALNPRGEVTKVYEVPGIKLGLLAEAVSGQHGIDSFDLLVYCAN